MKILGNRVLVSKVEEQKSEGFQTVDVQDSFIYKGKVEDKGNDLSQHVSTGSIVLFARNSPETQDIPVDGKIMKIINVADILAIL